MFANTTAFSELKVKLSRDWVQSNHSFNHSHSEVIAHFRQNERLLHKRCIDDSNMTFRVVSWNSIQ